MGEPRATPQDGGVLVTVQHQRRAADVGELVEDAVPLEDSVDRPPDAARVADEALLPLTALRAAHRVVEEGPSREVTLRPLHPYTAALVSAAPDADPFGTRRRIALAGSPPSAVTPPGGCPFHPRCPIARERCREERPELREVAPGRTAACFYPGEMP